MDLLTDQQVQQFHKDGYLILENYLSTPEIKRLRNKISVIIRSFDMKEVSIFSTTQQTRTSDVYFLESGDKIRCFFEEGAFDSSGNLMGKKEGSINKVGHALHDLDEDFRSISYKKELAGIARSIGMNDPLMVQSQYIFKQPRIGGKVVAHQDSTFIYTSPPTCIGFWMALEDATLENGCLMAIPGSHKEGIGTRRFVRNPDGKSTAFIGANAPEWDISKMLPLEATSGSLVILHGACVHMSHENRSQRSRHAYIIHMVEKDAHWPADNWLQRSRQTPFRKLSEGLI